MRAGEGEAGTVSPEPVLQKIQAALQRPADLKMTFVIGSGRSGTNWLGRLLKGHPDLYVTIERPFIFNRVTAMALDASRKEKAFRRLVYIYRIAQAWAAPRLYVDKSHPNIWLVEDLVRAFPGSRFIGIQRTPYATVASMLKHEGVLFFIRNWKEFPVPNPFLGITRENQERYGGLSMAAQCALRWRSHCERLQALTAFLGPRLHVIPYEDLVQDHGRILAGLAAFLDLSTPVPPGIVRERSLDRWRSELTARQIQEIDDILGDTPPGIRR